MQEFKAWRSKRPRGKVTKQKLPKYHDVHAAQQFCPLGCTLFESVTEGRIRIFLPKPGRPST
eukprot:7184973-Lingulodinium_polyedra.AAC.1